MVTVHAIPGVIVAVVTPLFFNQTHKIKGEEDAFIQTVTDTVEMETIKKKEESENNGYNVAPCFWLKM